MGCQGRQGENTRWVPRANGSADQRLHTPHEWYREFAIPQINVMAAAFLATLREHKQTMFAINTLFHLCIGPLDSTRAIKKTNRTNHNTRMKNRKHSYIFASAPRAPLTDDTMPGTRLLAGLLRIWSHLMITMIMRILMMIMVMMRMRMRMGKWLIAGLLSIWPQLAGFFVISIISS